MNIVLHKRLWLAAFSSFLLLVGVVHWGLASPPVPQSLVESSSVVNGTATVNLDWPASAGATSYKVYRATDNATYGTAIATVTAPTTAYSNSAPAGPLYRYVVTAVDATGESGPSNEIVLSTTLPPAPNRPSATAGDSSATITWNSIPGTRFYRVYKNINYNTVAASPTTNSCTISGLTNGTQYGFQVSAVTAAGEGPRSDWSLSVTPGPLPITPTNFAVTTGIGQVSLSWTGGADTIWDRIWRSEFSGGVFTLQQTINAPATSYIDSNVLAGRTYYYKVEALNNIGGRSTGEVRADLPALSVSFSNVASTSLNVHLPDLPQYATTLNLQRAMDTATSVLPTGTGRVCWYRADGVGGVSSGSGVAVWNDGATNNRLAFQEDADRRPLWIANAMNGRPALRFDGFNDRLQTASTDLLQNSDNFSVLVVMCPDRVLNGFPASALLDYDHQYEALNIQPSGWVFQAADGSTAYSLGGMFNDTNGYQLGSPSAPTAVGQPSVIVGIKSGASVSGYLNGTSLGSQTIQSSINSGSHPLAIGNVASWPARPERPFSGDIAEILIYNRAITSTERQSIENYLLRKYGVARAVPSGLTWTTIATDLDGGDVYNDTGLLANKTYWYRVVTTDAPGVAGQPNHVTTFAGVVESPAAPTFSSIYTTSVTVQGVALPANAQSMVLQKRLADDSSANFVDVKGGVANLQAVTVTNLEPGTTYAFRYVAVADGQAVPGASATVVTKTDVVAGTGGLRGYYYAYTNTPVGTPRHYFVNKRLERIDPEINFDWGSEGRPSINLPSLFAARWVGKVKPAYTETYTFFTEANGNSQASLWVNGQQIINQQGGNATSSTIALTAGTNYDIRLEYVQLRDNATIRLLWQSATQAKSIVPYNRLTANAKGTGTGLRAQYFNHRDLSSQVLSRTDAEVDFEWGNEAPLQGMNPDDASMLWTGQVQPRYSGAYTFTLYANPGAQLWVNNQLLVDQWSIAATGSGTITLTANQKYNIKVAFTKKNHPSSIWLWWSSVQQFEEIIPQERLFPAAADAVAPISPLLNDAVFLSQQIPNRIPPSTTFPVSVTFRNAGTSTWSGGNGYSLHNFRETGWSWGGTDVFLPYTVAPGQNVTFTFNLSSPANAGFGGEFEWLMVKQSGGITSPFGDSSRYVIIVADYPPPAPSIEEVGTTSITLRTPPLPNYAPGYTVTGYTLQRATGTVAPVTVPPTGSRLWLKADSLVQSSGSPIGTWSDSSGSGRHATQTTSNQMPLFVTNVLNGKPAVRFDGVDDWLGFTELATIRSAFVVMRHNTGSQDYAAFLGHSTAAPHFHSDLGDVLISPTYATSAVKDGTAFVNGNTTLPIALKKPTSWSVLSFLTAGNASSSALSYDRNIGGRFWNGDFAEVLLYNTVLSTAQRQQAETYLANKYNLPTPAPAGVTWTTIATGLAGDTLYTDSNCSPTTNYWYRVVLEPTTTGGVGESTGVATNAVVAAPDAPGAPAGGVVTPTTITVTAPGPALPARADSLSLQMRLSNKPDSSYVTVADHLSPGSQTQVTDLTPQTIYRFRYVAVGLGGETVSTLWAEYTTSIQAPEPPEAPSFSDITTNSMTVTLPLMPERATSLALQWKFSAQPDTAFATVATNPAVIDLPKADQAVTSLPAEAVVQITQLVPGSSYSFRCVATGPGGSTPGVVAGMSAGTLPPDPPNAPTFRDIGLNSVSVIAPALPTRADALRLQGRLMQSGTAWIDITGLVTQNSVTPVTGLTQGALYSFRFVAVGMGGITPGLSANVRLLAPIILWQPGASIQCNGIRWPQTGATLTVGSQGKVSAYLATDWDERSTIIGTGSWLSRYTDTCTYEWSCSSVCFQSGGGFDLNGVRVQTIRAQSPQWIAPTVGGPQTLTLVVDDQNNNNKPNDEGGAREDAARGFNDDPLRFSVTVTVQ